MQKTTEDCCNGIHVYSNQRYGIKNAKLIFIRLYNSFSLLDPWSDGVVVPIRPYNLALCEINNKCNRHGATRMILHTA